MHNALCERAVRWLRGSRGCAIALSGIASTQEIPDAIGWSTRYKWEGSIVVECKTSLSDFYAEKKKWIRYRGYFGALKVKGKREDLERIEDAPKMGLRRYFLTPLNLVSIQDVEKHYPDHGLLYLHGKRILVIRDAPVRENPDYLSEIRLLTFALRHINENLLRAGFAVDLCKLTKFFGWRDLLAVDRSGL